ncbi:MAG: hypothetical protein GKR98_17800 [Boseongicola sp.]|nr:MAG: hypothetical protein GKR98_17800 [Boseongicola sp.]
MSNVIAFPTETRSQTEALAEPEGATLFIHYRNSTMIAHLAKPRANRVVPLGKTNKA